MRSIKIWSAALTLLFGIICADSPAQAEQLQKWRYPVKDIHGRPITLDTFVNRVTVVSFSSQKSRTKDMQLGLEIGQKFGKQRAYQSLVIPNTSHVPQWAKFVASIKIAGAEKKAVREATKRQKAIGNNLTEDDVRQRIFFVHDMDGKVWERFGIDLNSNRSFLGIIDRSGTLIHVERTPINREEFTRIVEMELRKQNSKFSP